MRITPGEASERDVRSVSGGRAQAVRTPGPPAERSAPDVDADGLLPRSIARSQMVVTGLKQLQRSLDGEGSVDLRALVAAVRFEGEPVLQVHEKELSDIARTRDSVRLARLIDNTESNVLALLARSGVRGPERLLSAAESPGDLRALLERTIAAVASRSPDASALRAERVLDLLKGSG